MKLAALCLGAIASPLRSALADGHDHHYHSVSCTSSDGGATLSYSLKLECEDDTCGTCEETLTGTSPGCVEETHDGEIEYVSVVCQDTTTANVTIYSGLATGLGDAGCSSGGQYIEDTSTMATDECVEDDHGFDDHAGEEELHLSIECNGNTGDYTLSLDCSDEACESCEETLSGFDGDCLTEEHDGELEYVLVSCNASGAWLTVFDAACTDAARITESTTALTSGACVEDGHGFHAHDEVAVDDPATRTVVSGAVVVAAAAVAVAAAVVA